MNTRNHITSTSFCANVNRHVTMLGKFGDAKVLAVEGSTGEGDAQEHAFLALLERLLVGRLAHLLQERNKVLGVVAVATTQLIRRAI